MLVGELVRALAPRVQVLQNLINVADSYEAGLAETDEATLVHWERLWLALGNIKTLCWTIPASDWKNRIRGRWGGLGLPPSLLSLDLRVIWGREQRRKEVLRMSQFKGYRDKLRSLSILPNTSLSESKTSNPDLYLYFDMELPSLTKLHLVGSLVSRVLLAPNLTSLTVKLEYPIKINWAAFAGYHQLQTIAMRSTAGLDLTGHTFPTSLQRLCLDVGEIREDGCLGRMDMSSESVLSLMHIVCNIAIDSDVDLTPFTHASRACYVKIQHGKWHVLMPPSENDIELTWQRLVNFSESRSQHFSNI